MSAKLTLDRINVTEKMIFFGFKQKTMKPGKNTFAKQMFTTSYASLGELKPAAEEIMKKLRDKFGIEIIKSADRAENGRVVSEKEILLADVFPDFAGEDVTIDYEYITAERYELLNVQERKAYQPAVNPRTNFYSVDADGNVVRNAEGKAVLETTAPAYFTDLYGNVMFRTSVITATEYAGKKKLHPMQLTADVIDELPAAARTAINAVIATASSIEATAADLAV